jgi:hypothetical protein
MNYLSFNMSNYLIQQSTDDKGGTHMTMKDTIIFNASNDEMLKVAPDGFYVRGVKVPQDKYEAEMVYKTFHQWLTWATLNRSF